MKIPVPSTLLGTLLMSFGVLPMALWLADLVGLLTLTRVLPEWSVILMTMFAFGVGWMLYKGEGSSIGDAFMWWFRRGQAPHEDSE